VKKWFDKSKKDKENLDTETPEGAELTTTETSKPSRSSSSESSSGYLFAKIPWTLSASYSLRYVAGREWDEKKNYYKMEFRHNLSFSGSIGLGNGWKASTSLSYDVNAKKLSYTSINVSRDLHCWSMSASFVPFGPFKSYTFHIGVNASMLADLKYDTSSADASNKRVSWW
jgi:hypothetical protein